MSIDSKFTKQYVKVKKKCKHDNLTVQRIYDVGLYKSSYKLCESCSDLPEFNENVLDELKLVNCVSGEIVQLTHPLERGMYIE
jgi:hypothetical protein